MRRVLGGSIVSTLGFVLWCASGCGSDAVGVDDCRHIEQARCSAAEACGDVPDIEACQRFYRDQCLHGLSVPTPGGADVEACVQAIADLESCVRESNPSCAEDPALREQACDIVRHPELAPQCSFLGPSVRPGTGGSGSGGTSATAGESSASTPGAGAGDPNIPTE